MTYRGHIKNGVAVLDEAVALPEGTAVRVEVERLDAGFWANKNAPELAQAQGVKPIQSAADLAGDWPPEDSVDEFLDSVRKARR